MATKTKPRLTIDELIATADYSDTYELGPCAICGAETWCGARVDRADGKRGKRFIHLCFREHRNKDGLRQALEAEKHEEEN